MDNPNFSDRSPDPLAGSPEQFATNLLIVNAIEQGLNAIELERTNTEVIVKLYNDERQYEAETLTEYPERWSDIRDKFREKTEFSNNEQSGIFKPSIPATNSVDEIPIEFKNNAIEITFID